MSGNTNAKMSNHVYVEQILKSAAKLWVERNDKFVLEKDDRGHRRILNSLNPDSKFI